MSASNINPFASASELMLPWKVSGFIFTAQLLGGFYFLYAGSAFEISSKAFLFFWVGVAICSLPGLVVGLGFQALLFGGISALDQKKLVLNFVMALLLTSIGFLLWMAGVPDWAQDSGT